jgi:aminoglycoside phosphotransferase family enzyme
VNGSQPPTTSLKLAPITLGEKVAALSRAETYSESVESIRAIETHMAWVFLAGRYAFKLKKDVHYEFLDCRTIEKRRDACDRELVWNRRLAADVYLDVVPLTRDPRGSIRVDGKGEPIDWLVKMRRLDRRQMLDYKLLERCVTPSELDRFAAVMGRFYRQSDPVGGHAFDYYRHMVHVIEGLERELKSAPYGLAQAVVSRVAGKLQQSIECLRPVIEDRIAGGWVIDCHGDLRPEHVCLESPPVIIDCLDFHRELRLQDTASEWSFLTLECEMLGSSWVGRELWNRYLTHTGDRPDTDLSRFYRAYHAWTRAKLAIRHLNDAIVACPQRWRNVAVRYLLIAERSLGG